MAPARSGSGPYGVIGDREFLVVGEDGQLLLTSRNSGACANRARLGPGPGASWRCASRTAKAAVIQGTPEPGAAAVTRMYDGREIPGLDHPRAAQRRAVWLPRPGGAPVQTGASRTSVTMTSP